MNELQKAQAEIQAAEQQLNAAKARLEELSKPVEREYRAGDWVPDKGAHYYFASSNFGICSELFCDDRTDKYRIKNGNAFPTKAIAEADKAHADWWREFDTITDEQAQLYRDWGSVEVSRGTMWQSIYIKYAPPKVELSLPFIERLGGEQKVIGMLQNGRVFRFKWGGQ